MRFPIAIIALCAGASLASLSASGEPFQTTLISEAGNCLEESPQFTIIHIEELDITAGEGFLDIAALSPVKDPKVDFNDAVRLDWNESSLSYSGTDYFASGFRALCRFEIAETFELFEKGGETYLRYQNDTNIVGFVSPICKKLVGFTPPCFSEVIYRIEGY